jgi:hypothetical protein
MRDIGADRRRYAGFLASTHAVENVMTIGNVKIEIEEDWDEDDADDMVPGQSKVKAPWVNNTGSNDAFVRMYLTGNWEAYVTFDRDNITTNRSNWGPDFPWFEHTDGYFYYFDYISRDESTIPLFSFVTIREDLDSGTVVEGEGIFDDGRIHLVVNAEAIQKNGLFDDAGNEVTCPIEAFGFWNPDR